MTEPILTRRRTLQGLGASFLLLATAPLEVFAADADTAEAIKQQFGDAAASAKDGRVTLKLPPGTPNGRTLRARGKGAVRKDGTHGDLLVTVEVAVPSAVDGTAREALERYREATADTDPRAELFKAAKGA